MINDNKYHEIGATQEGRQEGAGSDDRTATLCIDIAKLYAEENRDPSFLS